MSNTITVVRSVFIDMHSNEPSYGFRMYDDYASIYFNLWEEFEVPVDDLRFLEEIIKMASITPPNEFFQDQVKGFLDHIREYEKPITIDSITYQWEEIAHLFP